MVPSDSRDGGNRVFARPARLRERLRLLAVLHCLAFFVAIAIAPHSHANSLEDLLTDGPSDSGIFVEQASATASEPGVWFRAARVVDDDPCLACFQNDFQAATEPASNLLFTPTFAPLTRSAASSSFFEPIPPTAPPRSRAPPLSA
jgi:hypothetical protein